MQILQVFDDVLQCVMRPFFLSSTSRNCRVGGSPIRRRWEAARAWARLPARPRREAAGLSHFQASATCLRAGGARRATPETARTGQGGWRQEHPEVAASPTPAPGRAAAVLARRFRPPRPRWRPGRRSQPLGFLPGCPRAPTRAGAGAAGSVCLCLGANAVSINSGRGSFSARNSTETEFAHISVFLK